MTDDSKQCEHGKTASPYSSKYVHVWLIPEYTEHSNLIAYCLNEFSTPGQKFGEKTQIHRLSLIHTHSHVHSDSLVTQVTPERHRHWQLRDTPEGRKVKQKTTPPPKKNDYCSHKQKRRHLIHSHIYFYLNKQHILKNPKVISCMADRKPYFLILVKFKDRIMTPYWNTHRFRLRTHLHFPCISFILVSFSLV